jgi:hypothetical protein
MSKIKYLSNGTVKTAYFSLDRPNTDYFPVSINGKLEYAFTCTASSPLVSNLRVFNNGIKKYILGPPSNFYSTAATFSTAVTDIFDIQYNSSSKYFIASHLDSPLAMPPMNYNFQSNDNGVTWNSIGERGRGDKLKSYNNMFYNFSWNVTVLTVYQSLTGSSWTAITSSLSIGFGYDYLFEEVDFYTENNKFFITTKKAGFSPASTSTIYSSNISPSVWSTSYTPYIDTSFKVSNIIGNNQNILLMYLYSGSQIAVMKSENNGSSWSNLLTPQQINENIPAVYDSFVYGNKKFVSCYVDDGIRSFVINESDISNFTVGSILKSNQSFLNDAVIKYHNGVFYLLNKLSSSTVVYRSSNGLDWDLMESIATTMSIGCGFEGGFLLGVKDSKVYKTLIK